MLCRQVSPPRIRSTAPAKTGPLDLGHTQSCDPTCRCRGQKRDQSEVCEILKMIRDVGENEGIHVNKTENGKERAAEQQRRRERPPITSAPPN